MIFSKMWQAFKAQVNKLSNSAWSADPIAQMQYEYDKSVDQLREGREGLEQYRSLVERVTRQVANDTAQANGLEAKVRAFLNSGDRDTAAKFALELQKVRKSLEENQAQLKMHEEAYNNNLTKVKHATGKLAEVRTKIQKYDADLKMSRAEGEMAKLAQNFNLDLSTDFGQAEQQIQDQISLNRAKARVAADLSSEGLDDVRHDQTMEQALADQALHDFENQVAGKSPTVKVIGSDPKELPAHEGQPAISTASQIKDAAGVQ
jgi:phage shock protein A